MRVPIRLGEDSFTMGEISKRNIKRMVKAMKAFKLLMNVHGVSDYLAFGTSAISKHGIPMSYIELKKEAGVKVEIISPHWPKLFLIENI